MAHAGRVGRAFVDSTCQGPAGLGDNSTGLQIGVRCPHECQHVSRLQLRHGLKATESTPTDTRLSMQLGWTPSAAPHPFAGSATLDEWLMAAEYIMAGGNSKVILCERGVRTFADHTRNTLDLSIIPPVKKVCHLPILVDPSHGTGHRDYVIPMSLAALAAGADGLIVEIHPDPPTAMSDGQQSLDYPQFTSLLEQLRKLATVIGRRVN
ncbi:MAG: hypothetical protein K1X57_19490 [Gemmataceae bacterium]|nr:hypothetical protein [Gemmataceae bacterium]